MCEPSTCAPHVGCCYSGIVSACDHFKTNGRSKTSQRNHYRNIYFEWSFDGVQWFNWAERTIERTNQTMNITPKPDEPIISFIWNILTCTYWFWTIRLIVKIVVYMMDPTTVSNKTLIIELSYVYKYKFNEKQAKKLKYIINQIVISTQRYHTM